MYARELSNLTMGDALSITLEKMIETGEITERDAVLARLAQEVAHRIDIDGETCYVSLYARLYDLTLALRHEKSITAGQLVNQIEGILPPDTTT